MPRVLRLPFIVLAALIALLVAGRGSVGRFLRTLDQRTGLFAPRGARLYNAVAPALLRPLYERVASDVAAQPAVSRMPAISAVLEIGSGPGELAVEISRRLPGAEILGVDLAEAMIERATERSRQAGVEQHVLFQRADAAQLPLAEGSFDVAVSTLSLHHWADPAAAFLEIGRVLRPGGVGLIYDVRPFTYTARELKVFLAGSPFEPSGLERDLVRLGPGPALFVRIRLVRAAGG